MAETSHPKLVSGAALAAGVFVAAMVTLNPEGLRAPAWVAYLAAALFALAGAVSLARTYQRPLIADGLVCVVLSGMLVVGLWVSLGPGPRQCLGRISGTGVVASELACRSAFGVGALLVGGMLALAVRGWLRRRSAG
jgi:hypothetical protein